jgi:quercetin dioxygenase-like cupin family protein
MGEQNMTEIQDTSAPLTAPLPADDPRRHLVVARPDTDQSLPHVGLVGDTYTVLLAGGDTDGRFCLIDMHVPPGGGPPPHRHDFEETFIILEGEIEVTFRDTKSVVRAGETANVPANAPHAFTNAADRPARLLCLCAPAGQEEYFLAIGQRVATRTTPPPALDAEERAAMRALAQSLAPRYRSEFV